MYIFNKNGIKITGLMKDPEDERDFKISLMKTTLPKYKDWQNMMSPVKHQGQLGSCVGFAITAMKEFQEQREHKKEVEEGKKNHRDEKYYDLAEAWIYWMCKKIDPWPNKEGTSIRHAMQVLQKIGVPTEKAWPYDDKIYGEPKMWAPLVAKWSKIKSYRRIVGINDLKVALRSGPVTVGIGCYEEIYKPDYNGFIKYPKNPNYCYGGHAVCLVSYNDNTNRCKFKNSWGTSWGKKGYGSLSYDYLKDFMWDAWSCQDLSVTKEMMKGTLKLL